MPVPRAKHERKLNCSYQNSNNLLLSFDDLSKQSTISAMIDPSYGSTTGNYYHFLFSVLLPLLDLITGGIIRKDAKIRLLSCGIFNRLIYDIRDLRIIDIEIVSNLQFPIVMLENFDPYYRSHRFRSSLILRPCALDRSRIGRIISPLIRAIRPIYSDVLIIYRDLNNRRTFNMVPIERSISDKRVIVSAHLESTNLDFQISRFMGTKCIVAQHGAGLANIVWCLPGTKVIELCPVDRIQTPYFELLSRLIGLEYTRIVQIGSEYDIVTKIMHSLNTAY